MQITFGAGGDRYDVAEVGYNQLRQVPTPMLGPGEVGYVVANVRHVKETRVGDTIFDASRDRVEPLPGYRDVRVDGLRRTVSDRHVCVRATSATRWRSCSSTMPRCSTSRRPRPHSVSDSAAGFLGLLHMEIVQERLEREFDLDLVTTVPSVEYKVYRHDGAMMLLENPSPHAAGRRGRATSRSRS